MYTWGLYLELKHVICCSDFPQGAQISLLAISFDKFAPFAILEESLLLPLVYLQLSPLGWKKLYPIPSNLDRWTLDIWIGVLVLNRMKRKFIQALYGCHHLVSRDVFGLRLSTLVFSSCYDVKKNHLWLCYLLTCIHNLLGHYNCFLLNFRRFGSFSTIRFEAWNFICQGNGVGTLLSAWLALFSIQIMLQFFFAKIAIEWWTKKTTNVYKHFKK